jgi:hypothetical protein
MLSIDTNGSLCVADALDIDIDISFSGIAGFAKGVDVVY